MSTATRKTAKKGKSKKAAEEDGKALAQMPLGKQLAHTDKQVRDQGIRNLEAFLSQTDGKSGGYVPLDEKEMAKLWKGLFYCFWMSDKPLVQQGLATDLANLVLRINPVGAEKGARLSAALAFLNGFWTTIVREWNGIDRLRMDKYYMLIRRYINATFRLLAREEWRPEAVDGVTEILIAEHGPMTWRDKSVPTSLATHIADVYLDELNKVLAEDGMDYAPIVALLTPHIELLARTRSQLVHTRLMNVLFSPLLAALKDDDERPVKRRKGPVPVPEKPLAAIAANCDGEPDKVRSDLLKAMFKAAAAEEAVDSNRRKIYALVREEDDDDDDDDE